MKRPYKGDYPFSWYLLECDKLPWQHTSRLSDAQTTCYRHDSMQEKLDKLLSEDCFYGIGKGYNGNISVTRSGFTCQSWSSRCPHQHNITRMYPELVNSSNFCRNPGSLGEDGPWCFTTNPNVTWEYCNVPRCPERGPGVPPPRVRANVINSTSITVTWDQLPSQHHGGVLQGHHVECGSNANSSVWISQQLHVGVHSAVLSEFRQYTNYSCRVRAVNNFGNGSWSDLVTVLTDEGAPSSPPESLKAWNTSSTSLNVTWGSVPLHHRNGRVIKYILRWRSVDGQWQRNTSSQSVSLSSLREFTQYFLDVSAVTRAGVGPATSPAVLVQTDEDVPSAPPSNVKAWNISSTSIRVRWEEVPLSDRRGWITEYIVRWQSENGEQQGVKSTSDLSLSLEGLTEFTRYSLEVSAATRIGRGPASKVVTRTDEDVPSRPVQNVTVTQEGYQSIRVSWQRVPAGHENGIVRGYKIQLINDVNGKVQLIVAANGSRPRSMRIGGLKPDTEYSIQVLAYTAKGDGPPSAGIKIRTAGDANASPTKRLEAETYIIAGLIAGLSTVGLCVAVIALIRRRKMKHLKKNHQELVAPYAVAGVQEMIQLPFYWEIDEYGARYRNLNIDGTLKVPTHLQGKFIDFEVLYENLRYQRLEDTKQRRRSFSGAIDEHGNPTYDTLVHKEPHAVVGYAAKNERKAKPGTSDLSMKRSQSVDLGKLGLLWKA